jgi:hypothetical protein
VIVNIKKYHGAGQVINYLLKDSKRAQIIDSSAFSESINKAITLGQIITGNLRPSLAKDLKAALYNASSLNPRLAKNTMHLMLGFDPADGKLSNDFKATVAKDLLEKMGFIDTCWVIVAHDRDDPEHSHVHGHDHIHVIGSRVKSNGKTISDSWDYPKTEAILRKLEQDYNLEPFIPLQEREVPSPEIHWLINLPPAAQDREIEQQEAKRRLTKKLDNDSLWEKEVPNPKIHWLIDFYLDGKQEIDQENTQKSKSLSR